MQIRLGFEYTDAKRQAIDTAQRMQAKTTMASQVGDLVEAAVAGDLTQRLDGASASSAYRDITCGLNPLLEQISHTNQDCRYPSSSRCVGLTVTALATPVG